MKKKQTIINRMLDILAEANELDDDIVDHHTFYEAYSRAVDQLDYKESEDGEFDIYRFTYNLGNRYFRFYRYKLRPILIAEGLNEKQRKEFIQKTFVLEEK